MTLLSVFIIENHRVDFIIENHRVDCSRKPLWKHRKHRKHRNTGHTVPQHWDVIDIDYRNVSLS